jgi:hypothetical protein
VIEFLGVLLLASPMLALLVALLWEAFRPGDIWPC